MNRSLKTTAPLTVFCLLMSACVNPEVVKVRSVSDDELTCAEIKTQLGQLENADPRPATGGEEAETLRFWSNTWQEFGEALAAWPEIRAAAEPDQ